MNALTRFIQKLKESGKYKRISRTVVTIMAAIVVFVTTYALILPALTMDKREATGSPGVDMGLGDEEVLGDQEFDEGEDGLEDDFSDQEAGEPEATADANGLPDAGLIESADDWEAGGLFEDDDKQEVAFEGSTLEGAKEQDNADDLIDLENQDALEDMEAEESLSEGSIGASLMAQEADGTDQDEETSGEDENADGQKADAQESTDDGSAQVSAGGIGADLGADLIEDEQSGDNIEEVQTEASAGLAAEEEVQTEAATESQTQKAAEAAEPQTDEPAGTETPAAEVGTVPEGTEAGTENSTEAAAETEAQTEKAAGGVTETETEKATEAAAETEAQTEKATEGVAETQTEKATEATAETEAKTEKVTEAAAETEAKTEKVTEAVTEILTEEATEAVTEAETEEATESVTEEATEEATESVTEEATEETTEKDADHEAGKLVFEGSDYSVNLSYTEEAKIPEGATLSVRELKEGTKEYEQYLEAANQTLGADEGTTADVKEVRFFDITILDKDGNEIQPEKGVKVEIAYDKAVKVQDKEQMEVLHFEEGSDEATSQGVEVTKENEKKGTVSGVSFDAESFSIYGVVYTVDYTYEGYEYSMEGDTEIALSVLFEKLGITGKVFNNAYDASLVQSVAFTDSSLLKPERREDDWYLVSLEPFSTEEKLTVTLTNGDTILIDVTDESNILNDFLGNISIDNVETTETDDDGRIKVGRVYSMHLAFAEDPNSNKQFATNSDLVYTVPAGIVMTQTSGGFNMLYSGKSYGGNTYTYNPASNTITVHFSDTVRSLVSKSADAKFTIDISGYFNGSTTHFDFGSGQEKDFIYDTGHDATIEKNGYYDSNDGKIHYTLTARSDGQSTNVNIQDIVTGTALTYDQNSVQVLKNYQPYDSSAYSLTQNGNGFNVNIPVMYDGDVLQIQYTASVDLGGLTGKGTVEQTGNTVKIRADGDPEEEKKKDFHNQIDYNPLKKSAGQSEGEGNTKTVPWTITINEQQVRNMAGATITDTNRSSEIMHYSGNGITIAVMDGNHVVRTEYRTWAQLGVTDPSSAAGWSCELPDTWDDRNNTYKYVITYTTEVDASGKLTAFQVNNDAHDDDGHSSGGQGNVQPGEDGVTFEKVSTGFNAAVSNWEMSFNVPKSGLTSAVVTDTFPTTWGGYQDTLMGDIEITGLIEPESYSIDTSDERKVVITFYKSSEKIARNKGLLASDSDRDITIRLTTKNDMDWVVDRSGDTHTNNAQLEINGEVLTDSAFSNPVSEGITKTGAYIGMKKIDGRSYPVFKYTLSIFSLNQESFDQNGNLVVISDDYDDEYLKLWTEYPDDSRQLKWYCFDWEYLDQKPRVEITDNNGVLTFTAPQSAFLKKDEQKGIYYSRYQLDYYMIPKNVEALNEMIELSIGEEGHKLDLTNTVMWGGFTDSIDLEFEYPVVDKQLLSVDTTARTALYKIVLNPDKLRLNGGEPMQMTDSATNLSIDYSTIVIECDPAPAEDITYYYRGNTGYYTIPDRTAVTITYKARIIGDGTITFSNEAQMNGYRDSTEKTENIASSAGGNLNIEWVLVYKHVYRQMQRGLNGAVYVLTNSIGEPILYPASAADTSKIGEPVLFTTGRIDLNATPDGLRVSEEENWRDGYAWLYLDKHRDGLALQKGITYYFREYEAPEGYQKDDTIYTFTIAEHPDYDDWEYYKGDVLRFGDTPVEGNLEIRKIFEGASNLTDSQKREITFRITGVDSKGDPIRIPYNTDNEGNVLTAPEEGLDISYADFENGVYRLDALPNGTYTVTETGRTLSGYVYRSTTYTVDGEAVTNENYSGTVSITDGTKHSFVYTNTYGYIPASINVIKKDSSDQIFLYGATFQLSKKDVSGQYVPMANHAGLTSDGKFTIDYENRKTGVKIVSLDAGEYMLVETQAPTDYVLDATPVYFTITAGEVKAGSASNGNNVLYFDYENKTVTVSNRIEHTYTLTKVDALKLSKKLNGAEFEIYEVRDADLSDGKVVFTYGDKVGNTLVTGQDGKVSIDADALGLATGKVYAVKETKAPLGYALNEDVYAFYLSQTAPALVNKLVSLDVSVVNLANGPQKTTVPNEEGKMEFFAKKVWYKTDGTQWKDLPDASWGIDEIEVKLYQKVIDSQGNTIETKQYPDDQTTFKLTKGGGGNNSWLCYKWTDLPTGKSDNTDNPLKYMYYVEEVVPDGFLPHYILTSDMQGKVQSFNADGVETDPSLVCVGVDTDRNIELINSPEPTSFSVEKVWLDDGNDRPGSINVDLKYRDKEHPNGVTATNEDVSWQITGEVPNVNLTASNNWSYTWHMLSPGTPDDPKTYYIVENNQDVLAQKGYVGVVSEPDENNHVVITNIKETSDKLKVKKVWLSGNGSEMASAPDTPVIVQLQKEEGTEAASYTVNVSVHNQWGIDGPASFKVAANGSISFTLQAGESSSYNAGQSRLGGGTFDPGSLRYTLSNVTGNTDVLIWFDRSWATKPGSAEYTKPDIAWSGEVTDVTSTDSILENGSPVQFRVTLNEDNSWTKTWENLTVPTGKVYRYSVREVEVPAGFEVSYENNDGVMTGIMYVKNTESEYTRAGAYKKWLDVNGNETAAPSGAEVVFALYADGRRTSQTVTLDGTVDDQGESDPWKASFEGLTKTKADGTPIVYTVKEITGYTGYTAVTVQNGTVSATDTSDTVASGGTIYNQKARTVTVIKEWQTADGSAYAMQPRETSVTIRLWKNGTDTGRSVTLDGAADVNGEQSPWVATFTNLDVEGTYTVDEASEAKGFKLVPNPVTSGSPSNGDSTVTLVNRESLGSLRVTKQVTYGGQETTSTLADGTYTFTITDADGLPATGKVNGNAIQDGSISVTVVNGTAATVTVTDLPTGIYTVTEEEAENGSTLTDRSGGTLGDDGVSISLEVVEDGTAEIPTAFFTNNTEDEKVDIEATKTWFGSGELWPENVQVEITLTADGEMVTSLPADSETQEATVILTSTDRSVKWTKLPKYDISTGKEITYAVTETQISIDGGENWDDDIASYYTAEGGDQASGYVINNTTPLIEYNGRKVWEDVNGNDTGAAHNNAEDIILCLTRKTADGEPEIVQVDNPVDDADHPEQNYLQPAWDDEGQFTYTDLPKYDEQGNEYTYSVDEAFFTSGGKTYRVVSTKDDNGNISYVVYNSDNEIASEYSSMKSIDAQSGQTVFTNRDLFQLEFYKIWQDGSGNNIDWSDQHPVLKFMIKRTANPYGTSVNDGASFTIHKNSNYIIEEQKGSFPQFKVELVETETTGVYKFVITGLPGKWYMGQYYDYWNYRISEVSPDGSETVLSGYQNPTYLDAGEGATPNQAKDGYIHNGGSITNRPISVALPATGGIGTTIFYVGGAVLLVAALILLISKRRAGGKDEEDDE